MEEAEEQSKRVRVSRVKGPAGEAGELYRVGQGVTPPRVLSKREPQYNEAARTQRVMGTVVLYVEVDQSGNPANIQTIEPLGFGLDEMAIEAVRTWRFSPGMKEGRPVRVAATIEVNFRLL